MKLRRHLRQKSVLLFAVLTAWLAGMVSAATVVFQDGQVARDVTVLSQTETHVELKMPAGTIRFQRIAIKSIDGQLLNVPSSPTPVPFASPAESPATEAVPAAGAAPPPVQVELPVAEENPAAPAPVALIEAPPEIQPSPTPIPAPVSEHRWNFEWILLALLVLAGVWMRSLQWVQKDLFERRADPRFWTMTALLLPGVGALIYAIMAWVSDSVHRRRTSRPGPAHQSSWNLPQRDPAAHLAARGQTRRGFEFLDTERKSIQSKGGGDLNSGLENAGEMLEEALLEQASDVHIEPTA